MDWKASGSAFEWLSFLKQVILTDTDSDALVRAARRLLGALGNMVSHGG